MQRTNSQEHLPNALLQPKHSVPCLLYASVCLPIVVQVTQYVGYAFFKNDARLHPKFLSAHASCLMFYSGAVHSSHERSNQHREVF